MGMIRDKILSVVDTLHKDDFAFTVEVYGTAYDVYRFVEQGTPGTLAFCMHGKQVTIAVFCKGTLTEDEVIGKIREGVH